MNKMESFLALYKSHDTAATYSWALFEYFKTVYGGYNPSKPKDQEYRLAYLNQSAERYFTETRNIEEDIQNFYTTFNGKPPKTVRLLLAAVRSFLIENERARENTSKQVSFRKSLGNLEKMGLVNGYGCKKVYNKEGVGWWKLTEEGKNKASEILVRTKDFVRVYAPLVYGCAIMEDDLNDAKRRVEILSACS